MMRITRLTRLCSLSVAATLLSGVASAQTTRSTLNGANGSAVEVTTGTVRVGGPVAPPDGLRFINVEGDAIDQPFRSFGLLRFDLSRIRNEFDAQFGADRWRVTNVTLNLMQTAASFSSDGTLLFSYTPDDTTSINSASSPYRYPSVVPVEKTLITPFDYVGIGVVGFLDTVALSGGSAGATKVALDIQQNDFLTLVAEPDNTNTPFVASGHRGQLPFFGNPAVQLVVSVVRDSTGLQPMTFSTRNGEGGTTPEVVTGTIQPGGPRTGANGDNFFNIQGVNSGNFASYGVARFNLTRVRNEIANIYGTDWRVTSVNIRLSQANAAFTSNGTVLINYTPDDTTSIKSPSTLAYPSPTLPNQQFIRSFGFVRLDDSIDNISLFSDSLMNAGATALANDVRTDNTLTVVIAPDDANTPGVAATWRGQTANIPSTPLLAPKLNVTAVQATKIEGTLTWENTGSPKPVTFVLTPTAGSPITYTTDVGPAGAYVLPGVPSGTYSVAITTPTYLRRVVTGVNTTSGAATLNAALAGGDADESNTVDVLDLDLLIQSFDLCVGDPGFNPSTDFNGDGCTDVLDLDVLIRNFDQEGD